MIAVALALTGCASSAAAVTTTRRPVKATTTLTYTSLQLSLRSCLDQLEDAWLAIADNDAPQTGRLVLINNCGAVHEAMAGTSIMQRQAKAELDTLLVQFAAMTDPKARPTDSVRDAKASLTAALASCDTIASAFNAPSK